MVRKRSSPLTDAEVRKLALRVYKEADPEEGPMGYEVGQLLDDMDLDLAAGPDGEANIYRQAQELWSQAQQHPGHPRAMLRGAAVMTVRNAAGATVMRWHIMDAMEAFSLLPANETDIHAVEDLANRTELVAFVPPDEPLHTAETLDEVLSRCSHDQLYALARGAVDSMATFGAYLEWNSDMLEWVPSILMEAKAGMALPPISDQNVAAANWWRRLIGGMNPLEELEGREIETDDDTEVVVWSPEDSKPFSSTVDRGRAVSFGEFIEELFSVPGLSGEVSMGFMNRADAGRAGPLASAAEFKAIRRTEHADGRHTWEFQHIDDEHSTRGGWAVPDDRFPNHDAYLGVRRCTREQWMDPQEGPAPDQAHETQYAEELVRDSPRAIFVFGTLTQVAAYLSDPTPGGR